jgi:hypothetical protein
MVQNEYIIEFITSIKEGVWAFNVEDAEIIARARQIEKGNDRNIRRILEREPNKENFREITYIPPTYSRRTP